MKFSIKGNLGKLKDKVKLKDKSPKNDSKFSKFKENLGIFWKQVTTNKVTKAIFSTLTLKIVVWALLTLSCIQIIFAVLIYGFKSESPEVKLIAQVFPYPVAIVNQDVVTYNDYLAEKSYIHHFYESTDQSSNIDFKTIDSQIMDQLIENKLINTQALARHVKVNQSDVDAAVSQIVDQNGGQDKVEKVLNDLYGITLNQFRDLVRTQMLRDAMSNKVIVKVTARHILIRVDQNATQDQIDAAKKKAEDIKTQIANGMSFEDAAKKYSEDTGSADNGGLLEAFAPGEMVKPFSDAAFSAPIGEVVGPVKTEFGWHLIKVESKSGSEQETFTEWIAKIKSKSLVIKFIK